METVEPKTHIIDCDADPFIPYKRWTVEEHKKSGKFIFDASKIKFYLYDKRKGGVIVGNQLRKELESQPVLNANVLDYLMHNQHLIPDEWKQNESGSTLYVFFWGTIYRDSDGNQFVRYLFHFGGYWQVRYRWLGNRWGSSSAIVVSTS